MCPVPTYPRGMYFEEFQPGQQIVTAGRTITESDIVNFAGLSGDFTNLHTDAEFSKGTPFGQRVAHGLLGLSVASGLAAQLGILEGTVIAFREINQWKFVKPVFIGDAIHLQMEIKEVKEMHRAGGGLVVLGMNVMNQNDETVMKGAWTVLVASHPDRMTRNPSAIEEEERGRHGFAR